MAIPLHKAVTSCEAIVDSIKTDQYVSRWFSHLIIQPAVQEQLKSQGDVLKLYQSLARSVAWQAIVYALLIVCVVVFWLTKDMLSIVPFILLSAASLKNIATRKNIVSQISLKVLAQDFPPQELGAMTLFHLGEVYSRKYKIPSLVDTIYSLDKILRRTVIWVFVLTCFIYPLAYTETFFWVIAGYFTVRLIVNLAFFYKRLA